MFLFVGEKRSRRARKLGLTWQDGGLAAKPLFEALRAAGIDPERQDFTNLFERGGPEQVRLIIPERTIVAMGRKVDRQLERMGVPHVTITHPAARGAIRKRERYIAHIKDRLGGTQHGNQNDR